MHCLNISELKNQYNLYNSSEISDTYFNGDSNRSVIRTFSPTASCSIVSMRGLVRPDTMSDIVDFGSPVITETWRIVKFFLHIISPSNIFIPLL